MKHEFQLGRFPWKARVIIGLAAMQGCSYFKGKVPENHEEILKYGKHPTPQNDELIYNLQKEHRIVSCVYRICKIR